jgi:ribosomal-protein-alanine N-acetyltransferase
MMYDTNRRSNLVPIIVTKRLRLIPFTLDLKKAAMNDRAKLVEMLRVYVPEHWPGPDLAEALPFL